MRVRQLCWGVGYADVLVPSQIVQRHNCFPNVTVFSQYLQAVECFSGAHQCGQGTAILDLAYNSALFSADQDLQRTYY